MWKFRVVRAVGTPAKAENSSRSQLVKSRESKGMDRQENGPEGCASAQTLRVARKLRTSSGCVGLRGWAARAENVLLNYGKLSPCPRTDSWDSDIKSFSTDYEGWTLDGSFALGTALVGDKLPKRENCGPSVTRVSITTATIRNGRMVTLWFLCPIWYEFNQGRKQKD